MALAPKKENYHNIFSHLVEYGYHRPIEPLIFLWVNIDPDTPICIYRYSDLVSWRSQNSRKIALAP